MNCLHRLRVANINASNITVIFVFPYKNVSSFITKRAKYSSMLKYEFSKYFLSTSSSFHSMSHCSISYSFKRLHFLKIISQTRKLVVLFKLSLNRKVLTALSVSLTHVYHLNILNFTKEHLFCIFIYTNHFENICINEYLEDLKKYYSIVLELF